MFISDFQGIQEGKWSKLRVYLLRHALLLFGFGRWDKIAKYTFRHREAPIDEIQILSENFVSYICSELPSHILFSILDSSEYFFPLILILFHPIQNSLLCI
jgi:hypothetical protein